MRGTSVAVLVCAAGLVLTGCAGPSSARPEQPSQASASVSGLVTEPVSATAGTAVWSRSLAAFPAVLGGVISTAGRWWVVTRVPDDPAQPTAVLVGDAVGGAPRRLTEYPRVLAWPSTFEVDGRVVTVVVQGRGTRDPTDPASWSGYVIGGYDALTGRALWSRSAGGASPGPCFLHVDGASGRTLVTHVACAGAAVQPGRLVALDPLTGRPAWPSTPNVDARVVSVGPTTVAVSFRSDEAPGQPADAVALIQPGSGTVTGILPATLAEALVPTDALVPTASGRTVVTTAGQPARVEVVDAEGTARWQAPVAGPPLVSTVTGTVVLQTPDGGFEGRDLDSGAIRWRIGTSEASTAQLVLAHARDRYATGNAGEPNVAVDAGTGAVAFTGAFNDVNPAQWNGSVYVTWADSDHLLALDGPTSRSPFGVERAPDPGRVLFAAG